MRIFHCPYGCEITIRSYTDKTYGSIRHNCRNHIERAHRISGSELAEAVREMLGDFYRDSPEYEICDLPVWPEKITLRLEQQVIE